MKKKLWVKFPDKETYLSKEAEFFAAIADSDGKNQVVVYIENPKVKH